MTEFQSISSFTAVLARLSSLIDAMERARSGKRVKDGSQADERQVFYKGLTLRSPRSGRRLIRDLTIRISKGENVLVSGPDDEVRMALFRATAGLWDEPEGDIVRPGLERILFVTERPYLPRGTFRELFMRPWSENGHRDERDMEKHQFPDLKIRNALRTLGIGAVPNRFGGMDAQQTWENALTLSQQQLLVVGHVLLAEPWFVFLDKPSSTLAPSQIVRVLGLFRERSISYVTFEETDFHAECYDKILQVGKEGYWSYFQREDGTALAKGAGSL